MTPEEKQQIETQIQNNFSELQQNLENLKNDVKTESDEAKKQEKEMEIKKLEDELSEIKTLIDTLSSLQEADLQSLKTRLESTKKAYQEFSGEVSALEGQIGNSPEKHNEKFSTPTTYDLLKNSNSETYNRLLKIISENPDKFKDLKDDKGNKLETPDAKLEHIFNKIRENITILVGKKIGESEKAKDVIKNTIAPAFEWSLMETLRREGNESNVCMLEGIDKISWNNLNKLFDSVKGFSENYEKYFVDFRKWMNAVDYLSVNNWVLKDPNKSEVLSNPLRFQEYMNDSRFEDPKFSPYKIINGNIFKIDKNGDFKYGITSDEQQQVLSKIGSIQVVNNPKTTSLIVGLLDKSPGFLEATAGLQETGKHLLDFVDSINPVTKIFGIDIFKEIKSKETSLAFKVLDFVCKLIGITGGLEGIIKKWRMDRMNLTDEKNDNIREILEKYKNSKTENESLSIVDENSCKTALEKFAVTETEASTTKGDFLRDSIAENMDISLVSPVVIQQTLGEPYLQKQIITENGITKETYVVDESKFNEQNKKDLAHKHLENMKAHLEKYNENDLSEFYTNISSTEDLASCIIASLYVDKNDVIEGVEAKVFLPENYGSIHLDGTVEYSNSGKYISELTDEENEKMKELMEKSKSLNYINYLENQTYKKYLNIIERDLRLPKHALECICNQESEGKLYDSRTSKILTSNAGAQGLFQFMPSTADEYMKHEELSQKYGITFSSVDEFIKDPLATARAAGIMCSELIYKHKYNFQSALACYNWGIGKYQEKIGGDGTNLDKNNFGNLEKAETRKYVTDITKKLMELNEIEDDKNNFLSVNLGNCLWDNGNHESS